MNDLITLIDSLSVLLCRPDGISFHPGGFTFVIGQRGFGVPLFDLKGERGLLEQWAEKKGDAGIRQYWEQKNQLSLDGKPTKILKP